MILCDSTRETPLIFSDQSTFKSKAEVSKTDENYNKKQTLSILYFLKDFSFHISEFGVKEVQHETIMNYIKDLIKRVQPEYLTFDQKNIFSMIKLSFGLDINFPNVPKPVIEVKQNSIEKILEMFKNIIIVLAVIGVLGVLILVFFLEGFPKVKNTWMRFITSIDDKGHKLLFFVLLGIYCIFT